MRLAIIGSQSFNEPWKYLVSDALIRQYLKHVDGIQSIISGGCKTGVDNQVELIAPWYGYEEDYGNLIIHRPRNDQWEPNGFKERNILIAQDCTHMLCIRDRSSTSYGSGWTADFAWDIGVQVWRFDL